MGVFDGLDDIFVGVMGEDDPVTITPEGAPAYDVTGIFTARWQSSEAGDFGEFDGTTSAVDVKDTDLPAFPERAMVGFKGVNYRIVSVRPDEQGMTTLVLQRAGSSA